MGLRMLPEQFESLNDFSRFTFDTSSFKAHPLSISKHLCLVHRLSGTRPESNSRWKIKCIYTTKTKNSVPKINQLAFTDGEKFTSTACRTETGFSRAGGAERRREGNKQPPLRSRRSAGCEQRWAGGMPWRDEHANSEKPGQRADQSPIEAGECIKERMQK